MELLPACSTSPGGPRDQVVNQFHYFANNDHTLWIISQNDPWIQ